MDHMIHLQGGSSHLKKIKLHLGFYNQSFFDSIFRDSLNVRMIVPHLLHTCINYFLKIHSLSKGSGKQLLM